MGNLLKNTFFSREETVPVVLGRFEIKVTRSDQKLITSRGNIERKSIVSNLLLRAIISYRSV